MWFLILLMWATIAVVMIHVYVDQIENLPTVEQKIFSYIVFAAGGPVIFLAGLVVDTLEWLGIVFDDDDLWRQ